MKKITTFVLFAVAAAAAVFALVSCDEDTYRRAPSAEGSEGY